MYIMGEKRHFSLWKKVVIVMLGAICKQLSKIDGLREHDAQDFQSLVGCRATETETTFEM